MCRILLAFVLIVTAAAFLSRADEAAPKTVSTEDLITQLGSDDFAVREQAAKVLNDRGPSVLPALRKALKHKDAEVRRRVEELIPHLETVAAVAPKRVTLTGEKQPLSAILKEIEKQTGYTVEEEERNDDLRFAIEIKDVPFWEALERICRATDCLVVAGETAKEIRLKQNKMPSPFVMVADSFRLELTHVHEERDADFRQPGRDKKVGRREYRAVLAVSVFPEPKYLVIGMDTPQVESCRDEDGKPLVAAPELNKKELNEFQLAKSLHKAFVVKDPLEQAEIRLQRSETTGKTIKEVRGSIPVFVVVARKDVVATDKFLESKGTTFKIGNDTLEIAEASQDADCLSVRIHIAIPKPDHLEMHWDDRIRVEDAQGNRYKCDSWGNSSTGDKHWVTYGYSKPKDPAVGPPAKIIVEDWTIVRYPIPFVFKDVPLP